MITVHIEPEKNTVTTRIPEAQPRNNTTYTTQEVCDIRRDSDVHNYEAKSEDR